jgi:tRNA-dihydrouridine synthase B
MVYSEMVSANGLYYGGGKTADLLRFHEDERPVAFQLFGKDPARMAFAAEKLEGMGNVLLDVNMGCPVPKVVKNGEGAALLRDPDLAARIVEAMVQATSKPVTAKIRAGWDAGSVNAAEMAAALEQAGAAAVAVHGRTREQYYSGKADWELIRRVKAAVGIPVIGNGDVASGADAVRMLAETGCDYVMIARGALGNPWIFADALRAYGDGAGACLEGGAADRRTTGVEARLRVMARHLTMLMEENGEYRAVREMRKHVPWYLKGVKGSADFKRRANAMSEAAELFRAIEDFARTAREEGF